MELYRKIYIESEADLPKEGRCWLHQKLYDNTLLIFFNMATPHRRLWTKHIDWYLQPIEITDSDIEAWALKESLIDMRPRRYINASQVAFRKGLEKGAKAYRDNEIKHIK